MRAGFIGLGIIFVSIVISCFIILRVPKHKIVPLTIKEVLPARSKEYTDPIYHFSFSYPTNYSMILSKDIVLFKSNEGDGFVVSYGASSSGQIMPKPVIQMLYSLCSKNTLTTKCSIDSQKTLTTINGATGNSYYLSRGQFAGVDIIGPFVAFPLLSNSSKYTRDIIFYPEDLVLQDKNRDEFMMMINSFSLQRSRANLDPLSSSSAK